MQQSKDILTKIELLKGIEERITVRKNRSKECGNTGLFNFP